jgi:HEAT repeat protein
MTFRWPTEIDSVTVPYGRSALELQSLVTAGKAERWVAIVALAQSSDPNSLGCLGNLGSLPDAHVRRFVVQWIGRCPDGAKLSHVVVERLRDPSGIVVRTAAEVAGELAIHEAHANVLALLKDNSPSTREAGLRALERLWQEADFQIVLGIFKSDASEDVRRTAGWTLRGTRSAASAAVLLELWRADALARHRLWACEIVAEFPQREFHDGIAPLERDEDGHVRKAARRALEAIGRAVQQAVEALVGSASKKNGD